MYEHGSRVPISCMVCYHEVTYLSQQVVNNK